MLDWERVTATTCPAVGIETSGQGHASGGRRVRGHTHESPVSGTLGGVSGHWPIRLDDRLGATCARYRTKCTCGTFGDPQRRDMHA